MDVARSTIKLFFSRAGSSILFFTGITLFARWLPPDEFGVFFLYLAVVGVLTIVADLGIRGALEKRLSEGGAGSELLGSALAFKLVVVTLLVGVLLAATPVVDAYIGAEITLLLALGLVVREFAALYVHVVRGELRVGRTASIQFARRVVWLTVSTAAVSLGHGVVGLVVGSICGRLVEGVWAWWRSDTPLGSPSVAALRSMFAFSKYQTVIAVGGRFYQWMDVLIVGLFLSNAHVSAYEVAWQVTLLVLLVSKSLELNLFPAISSWDAEGTIDRIGETVSTALGYTMFVSIPAVVGASLYAREILTFVFQPAYAIASVVLVVLMVEKAFQSCNDIINASLRGLDRPRLAARVTVISVLLNLVLSPILVVTVGLVGAAVATAIAWLVNLVLQYRYLSQLVTVSLPVRLFGWYVLCSLLMGGVLLLAERTLPVTGLLVLLTHVALGVLTYVGALTLVPTVRRRVLLPGVRAVAP